MNLMHLIDSKDKTAKVVKLREEMVSSKINIIPIDKPALVTPLTTYYLNGVPNIPKEKDVVARWDNYLPIKVNWTMGKEVKEEDLKRQYAFCIKVGNVNTPKMNLRDAESYTIVFNNAETCQKHLKWFNSCFLLTKTQEEEDKKEALRKKQEKMRAKMQSQLLGE